MADGIVGLDSKPDSATKSGTINAMSGRDASNHEIRVLGTFEITGPGLPPLRVSGRTGQVLAVLASEAPRPVQKRRIHELIWGDEGEERLVEKPISELRGPHYQLDRTDQLVTQGASYALLLGRVQLDSDTFLRSVSAAQAAFDRADTDALTLFDEALALWSGEPFAGLEDPECVRGFISRLNESHMAAVEGQLDVRLAGGQHRQVIAELEAHLTEHPFRENLWALLMTALYRSGRQADSLKQFRKAQEYLLDIGLSPGPELIDLERRILQHDPALLVVPAAPVAPSPVLVPDPQPEVTESHEGIPTPAPVPGMLENLPPTTYARFADRAEYTMLLNDLDGALPVVQIHGIGGQGKTSLARKVAADIRQGEVPEALSGFSGVVWVRSQPDKPPTLEGVVDDVLRTLEFPAALSLPPASRLEFAQRVLRSQRCLIVIDGFDPEASALIEWILDGGLGRGRLVVTAREPIHRLRPVSCEIHLAGLSRDAGEIEPFVTQLLDRLGLRGRVRPSALDEIVEAVGGNPKAIEVAAGLVKRGRSPREVASLLLNDPSLVLDELVMQAWTSASEQARNALLTMLVLGPVVDEESLRVCTGMRGDPKFFDVVAELSDLSLLDVMHPDLPDRAPDMSMCSVHPLVHGFLQTRVASADTHSDALTQVHQRWIRYATELAGRVGFCVDDVSRLEILDVPGRSELVWRAARWALDHRDFESAAAIGRESRYYFYVRGAWESDDSIHLIRAVASRESEDLIDEFNALTTFTNIAAKQGDVDRLRTHFDRLEEIAATTTVDDRSMREFRHARALGHLADCKFDEAEDLWRANVEEARGVDEPQYSANIRWLGVCLRRAAKGDEAERLLSEAAAHARANGFLRAEVGAGLELAALHIDEGDSAEASKCLDVIEKAVAAVKDRYYDAEYALLQAKLLVDRNPEAAASKARSARELFGRLGHLVGVGEAEDLLSGLGV